MISILSDRFPRYKTVVVVGKAGTYGWSKRLRKAANCIVARWEGGDQILDSELDWHFDRFVRTGKITDAQRCEFQLAIGKLDRDEGGIDDLQSIRAFGRILGVRVIIKAKEPPLPGVKPGPIGMTYSQAYRFAAIIRENAEGVTVKVIRTDEEGQGRPVGWFNPGPGSYTIRVSPTSRRA